MHSTTEFAMAVLSKCVPKTSCMTMLFVKELCVKELRCDNVACEELCLKVCECVQELYVAINVVCE